MNKLLLIYSSTKLNRSFNLFQKCEYSAGSCKVHNLYVTSCITLYYLDIRINYNYYSCSSTLFENGY